jgi:hypothetical protein
MMGSTVAQCVIGIPFKLSVGNANRPGSNVANQTVQGVSNLKKSFYAGKHLCFLIYSLNCFAGFCRLIHTG